MLVADVGSFLGVDIFLLKGKKKGEDQVWSIGTEASLIGDEEEQVPLIRDLGSLR